MEGTSFGRYQLLELLGRGGMGEVWRANDTVTDRIVAVKVLPAHFSQDEVFQERFRREAHRAARLNNPHVIPIHTYGEIDGRLYVDMRLIEGRDLHAVLGDGPLDPARSVHIVEQIAKALHAAHKAGLVHRDVKPSNILLDEDDFAYLIDFGIARATNETGLTGTGSTIGTWDYMAPERLSSREVDARADIYALACVLYECLTGSRPYPGESVENQVLGHLSTPPPRPSTSRAAVPTAFDAVIATGMAKDPQQRYATTVELAQAARAALTGPTAKPAPAGRPEPPTTQAPRPPWPVTRTDRPAPAPAWQNPHPAPPSYQRPPEQRPPQRHEPPADRRPPAPPAPSSPPPAPQSPPSGPSSPTNRRPLIIAAAAVVVIAVGVALTLVFTSGGDDTKTDGATTSTPGSEPTTPAGTGPWSAHEFIRQAFPRLIPDAPNGTGYQGTNCYSVNGQLKQVPVSTESPIARIRCEANSPTGVSYTLECPADRSEITADSAGATLVDGRSENWQRGNSSGEVRWGTNNSNPLLIVAFNEPDRNFCLLTAIGGPSAQNLYDDWWKNAPI